MMRKLRYLAEYLPIYLLVKLVTIFPLKIARKTREIVAFILLKILRLRREMVEKNLQRAFPDKTPAVREKIATGCYRFYCQAAIEWMNTEKLLKTDKIEFPAAEILASWLNSSRGVIVATAHLGYRELAGVLVARRFGSLTAYADVIHNPYVDRLVERNRRAFNINTVTGGWALKKLVAALESGEPVGLVADQSKGSRPLQSKLFGETVNNTRMPAFLARKTGAPVIPLAAVRTDSQTIEIRAGEPLPVSLQGVTVKTEKTLIDQYNSWLEREITNYPEQYFWFHNRWK